MPDKINCVDVAFVVDTTGSMGPFILDAKRRMTDMAQRVSQIRGVDLRCVLIDYRDHPPQDNTYAAKLQSGKAPVTLDQFRQVLDRLDMGHGGDAPESVLDGIHLLIEVEWRENSRRIAFLIGDAPAHGYVGDRGYMDAWPDGCPCGKTAEGVTGDVEDLGVTLYGINLSGDVAAQNCFQEFTSLTGGHTVKGNLDTAFKLLEVEFGKLPFDGRVLEAMTADDDWTSMSVARAIGADLPDVDASIRRLLGRGLVPIPA